MMNADTRGFVADLLMEYGEYLDREGLLIGSDMVPSFSVSTTRKKPGEDDRSHEQLVEDFLISKGY